MTWWSLQLLCVLRMNSCKYATGKPALAADQDDVTGIVDCTFTFHAAWAFQAGVVHKTQILHTVLGRKKFSGFYIAAVRLTSYLCMLLDALVSSSKPSCALHVQLPVLVEGEAGPYAMRASLLQTFLSLSNLNPAVASTP